MLIFFTIATFAFFQLAVCLYCYKQKQGVIGF